ncbi:glycosyltransferase [Eubacterium sp.]|uniref:glycosyltransferase n=1 Tax=Eubacterium sp. TaxID=142586 RepID=UPI0025FE61CB|nr:glycosyltransferase [Eubacterium sp.]MCR5629808.1 glycosyltransferase [Eubacterium sp.]
MSKGTVIYFGNFEMPDKDASAHRVLNNAKIFKKIGYSVSFCGVDKSSGKKALIKNFDGFISSPRKYPKNSLEWIKDMVSFSYYRSMIDSSKNVKFVILYDFHAIPFLRIYNYCHKKGIKVLADITEWYENSFSIKPGKLIRWLDTNIMMKCLYKKVDGMIVISDYLKQYYSKKVPYIVIIPPLVDITQDIWTQKSINDSELIEFVYSGSTNSTKDKLGEIVDSFSSINSDKKYLLSIYGLTLEQFNMYFSENMHSLEKIKNNVRFKGYVSHKESIAALIRADYCIFIRDRSRKNMAGFPTKFVESYTSGINIIASNVSDIMQYFPKEKNNYLLKDGSMLRDVLEEVLCDKKGLISKQTRATFDYHMWVTVMSEFMNNLY